MLVIWLLEGNIPDIEGGKDPEREMIHACFCELQRIVGPHTNYIAYNKVLDNGTCLSSSWEVQS